MAAAEEEGIAIPWQWRLALSEATWPEVVRRWVWHGPNGPSEAASAGDSEALRVLAAAASLGSGKTSARGHSALLLFLMQGAICSPAVRIVLGMRAVREEEREKEWARRTVDFAALVRRRVQETGADLVGGGSSSPAGSDAVSAARRGNGSRQRRRRRRRESGSSDEDDDDVGTSVAAASKCVLPCRSESKPSHPQNGSATAPSRRRPRLASAANADGGDSKAAAAEAAAAAAAAAAASESAFVEECKVFMEERQAYMESRLLGGRRAAPLGQDGDGRWYTLRPRLGAGKLSESRRLSAESWARGFRARVSSSPCVRA